MNSDVMMKVLMSALFFAPLLIALVAFLFIGALVIFEAVVAKVNKVKVAPQAAVAPSAEAAPVGQMLHGVAPKLADKTAQG